MDTWRRPAARRSPGNHFSIEKSRLEFPAQAPTSENDPKRTPLCPVQVQNSRYLKTSLLNSKKRVLLRDGGATWPGCLRRETPPSARPSFVPDNRLGIAILRRVLW